MADPEGLPGGPHLSAASRMFLHHLLGLHLRRPSSRFDPRAHVAPSGLYKQTLAPLPGGIKSFKIKSPRAKNPNLLRAPLVSRALAS
jgi:hypothetical protein